MNTWLDARFVRMITASILLGSATMALSACNTTEGFGQDVKNTGQTISNTAQQAKPQ